LQESHFNTVSETRRVSDTYGCHFDNYRVTVYRNSVLQPRDNCH